MHKHQDLGLSQEGVHMLWIRDIWHAGAQAGTTELAGHSTGLPKSTLTDA